MVGLVLNAAGIDISAFSATLARQHAGFPEPLEIGDTIWDTIDQADEQICGGPQTAPRRFKEDLVAHRGFEPLISALREQNHLSRAVVHRTFASHPEPVVGSVILRGAVETHGDQPSSGTIWGTKYSGCQSDKPQSEPFGL